MPLPQDPPPVTTQTRLWSEEVALAEADNPLPPQIVIYEFASGRQFVAQDNPYA